MNPEIVPIHRKEFLRDDGMLFVRTDGILETMAKTPLIIVGLIVVALTIPVQSSFGSTRTLDLILYSDGLTHISANLDVDPLEPDFEFNLFGPSIDNFVAVNDNGFLLSSEIIDDKVIIDTFGSSGITIDYDIHDLISKEGRVWTFSLDSPANYSLLMPPNSIIVGTNSLPSNMDLVNDQTKLELSTGLSQINYIFSTSTTPITNPESENFDVLTLVALIAIPVVVATAAIVTIIVVLKRKQATIPPLQDIQKSKLKTESSDTDIIFKLRPEMREDDKEIIKFISENNGQALESELRKKFLQPRTTMWRAVKRLERQGVIEITKKDLQNLVKLKKELEAEEE